MDIRSIISEDIPELCKILNEIIEVGGTTAYEIYISESEFTSKFVENDDHISCLVAVDERGKVAGFQVLGYRPDLPDGWADIATFSRLNPKVRGVGTALFAETKSYARAMKITSINATIRSDNHGGVAFYNKMGFETYTVNKDVPLKNGEPVDRISKSYPISD